jgi:hypothetical protein
MPFARTKPTYVERQKVLGEWIVPIAADRSRWRAVFRDGAVRRRSDDDFLGKEL